MTYEDGYGWLQGYLDSHFEHLVTLMQKESDFDMRARFVELLGDSKRKEAIPILEQELESPSREVRSWAYSSLLYFEDSVAVDIAESFKNGNSKEDFL